MDDNCNTDHQINLALLDPSLIKSNPAAYQFRADGDEAGVTDAGRKKADRWDPILHGEPLLVHERLDGSHYVADGHHRLDLAQRLQHLGTGPDKVAAFVLREADGYTVDDVKLIAAYKNMEQGHATAFESAHVFKEAIRAVEAGKAHAHLLPALSMDKPHLRIAQILSQLSDQSLARVELGDVPLDAAILVATKVPCRKVQDKLLTEVSQAVHGSYANTPAIIVPQQQIEEHCGCHNKPTSRAEQVIASQSASTNNPFLSV